MPESSALPKKFSASIKDDHQDFTLLNLLRVSLLKSAGGTERLQVVLPELLQGAIDFVLDPVRTARNSVAELDNVEKTFIGLKIEHFLRDFLNVPKGVRDLVIDGIDVDVKNTVGQTWTIPPETYRNEEPCLLIAIADSDRKFWLGLIVARDAYLGSGKGNRDGKRSVTTKGMQNILWLVEGHALPASKWDQIDLARFRDLRNVSPGTARAAIFFSENLDVPIHREVLQTLLFDQRDYMKRLRSNGGARDVLNTQGIALLSSKYDRAKLLELRYDLSSPNFFVATRKQHL